MLVAQSLGEYGSLGSLVARIAGSFESAALWVQSSLHDDPWMWVAAAVAVAAVGWLMRRR